MSKYWNQARHLIAHNILHADDTPHSIALGASLAMFVAILPLIGIQMVLAVALAALFRVNKAIGIPIVWISNPITAVPLYGGCFALGRWILNTGRPEVDPVLAAELDQTAHAASWVEPGFWSNLLSYLVSMGTELWVGSAIVGLVLAILTYPTMRWLVVKHRERRRLHELQKKVLPLPIPLSAESTRKTEVA